MAETTEFDPTQPYEILDEPPKFDPSQPYEVLDEGEPQFGPFGSPPIPQAFLDRLRAGFEMQQERKAPAPLDNIDGDAFGVAAQRLARGALHGRAVVAHESEVPADYRTWGNLAEAVARQYPRVPQDIRDIPSWMRSHPEDIAKILGMAMPPLEPAPGGLPLQFSRVGPTGLQRIGELPTPESFADAATVLNMPSTKPLYDLWHDYGIHPAEAAHDAQTDNFMHEQLRAAAGADVTRDPPPPTVEEQPPPPPGSLITRLRNAGNNLLGLGRNLMFDIDPMAAGTARSQVPAKDFANTTRRIDWEWSRVDDWLQRNFSAAQRERMFTAMDEESVALQLGESRAHQGLATLEPDEAAAVRSLDDYQQAAWNTARDLGMVEGEGLPMHAPRYVQNMVNAGMEPLALDTIGRNLTTRTSTMLQRKYMEIEETEAAAKHLVAERMAKQGASPEAIAAAVEKVEVARDIRTVALSTAKLEKAIAGRTLINSIREIGEAAGEQTVTENEMPGYFTLNHPAMKTWRPRFKDGAVVTDEAGNTIFDPVRLHIADEFKGPLLSILEEPAVKDPRAISAQTAYQAYMTLKGKAMTAILNSPLIHNAVVWGKVMPSAPGQWLGFRLYWAGNRIANDAVRSAQLVERGLAPIGHRGSFQDITSVMEEPNLRAGRSWTSQVLGFIPGLFDEAAETAVKRAIDRAGDFYHNTLLWDRVRDVQFGLADHMSRNFVQGGMDQVAADRLGSHFANMIVGSIPREAMSEGARRLANVFLFSRSFTLGNLNMLKTATVGVPKPLLAQIDRDLGVVPPDAETFMQQVARRRAMGRAAKVAVAIVAIDYAVSKVVNSLLQNAANIVVNDSSIGNEMQGYADRLKREGERVKTDPFLLLNPIDFRSNFLGLAGRLSATAENEPGKENHIFIGYDKDGTAIYARNPIGKYPEELTGWFDSPFGTLRRKLAPFPAAALESMWNDKGFGRKVYDPTAETTTEKAKAVFDVVEHMVARNFPEMQLAGARDLLTSQGDQKLNALRTFAPMFGFTASQGAPGGPAHGEVLAEQASYRAKFDLAWPEIRKQIKNGNLGAATAAMTELGVPQQAQRYLIRSAMMPGNLSARSIRDFMLRARPEQQDRFLRTLH